MRCWHLLCTKYHTSVRTSTGATPLLPSTTNMDTALQYALQQGQPPLIPSIYNMKTASPTEVKVPSMKSSPRQLYQKNETSSQQKGSSLRISRRLYAQKVTIFQSESRGKKMPNHKGWWQNHTSYRTPMQSRNTLSKENSSISRKPQKAAYAKMSVSVDWKPERAVQGKIRDIYKKKKAR